MMSSSMYSRGPDHYRSTQHCKLATTYLILFVDLPRASSSADDVDRLLKSEYEPSDQDIVKARLRTVGVQEYHFSIPRGMHLTFYAS